MESSLLLNGFLLMIIGGSMEGIFSFPLKYTSKWAWENTWGAGALMALIILPWPLAFLTIPNLNMVYSSVPISILIFACIFGTGWGIGGIFFGKGIASLGFSIGMALIMGLIAIGGSIIPLAMNHPDTLFEFPGLVLLIGILIMITGLLICGRAGILKDRAQNIGKAEDTNSISNVKFRKGLIYCIIAGLLSALVNFGFIFGSEISEAAVKQGANTGNAGNAVLALVFTTNYVVNFLYCIYLTRRNKTFKNFFIKGIIKYWFMAIIMGLIWSGGIVVYGIGTTMIGKLGVYLGFPLMLIVSILAGNIFGVLTGEWTGVGTKPKLIMTGGVSVLIVAIIVLGLSLNLV